MCKGFKSLDAAVVSKVMDVAGDQVVDKGWPR